MPSDRPRWREFVSRFPHDLEPDGDVSLPHHLWVGLGLTAFAFGMVWPTYPVVGAAGTLLGLAIAADGAVEHAFGIPTPLDILFNRYIYPRLPSVRDG